MSTKFVFSLLVLLAINNVFAQVVEEIIASEPSSIDEGVFQIEFSFNNTNEVEKRFTFHSSNICPSARNSQQQPPWVSSCGKAIDTNSLLCFKSSNFFLNAEYINSMTINAFECDNVQRENCDQIKLLENRDYKITSNKFCLTRSSNQICKNRQSSTCIRFYAIVATTLSEEEKNGRCFASTNVVVSKNENSLKGLNGECKQSYFEEVTSSAVTSESITTSAVTSESITTSAITTESVTSADLSTGPITTEAVTSADLSTGVITSESITSSDLSTGMVTTGDFTTEIFNSCPYNNAVGTVSVGDSCYDDSNCDKVAGSINDPVVCNSSCICEGPSCFIGSTQILMSDLTYKRIDSIVAGDRVVGINGELSTVLGTGPQLLNSKNLVGMNEAQPFFSSEHTFLDAEQSDKYLAFSLDTAIRSGPGKDYMYLIDKIGYLREGSSLYRWEESDSALETTVITKLNLDGNADPTTPVYSLRTFNENSLYSSYLANNYLTALPTDVSYVFASAHFMQLYIYNNVKSTLDAQYLIYQSSHPGVSFNKYCGILGKLYQADLTMVVYGVNAPPFPSLGDVTHRNDWINFMKGPLHAITQQSGDNSAQLIPEELAKFIGMLGLGSLDSGKEKLDNQIVPAVNNLILNVHPQ